MKQSVEQKTGLSAKSWFPLFGFAIVTILFQNCSPVKFNQGTESQALEVPDDSVKTEIRTEEFSTGGASIDIDMVWVIDNSGSMDDEVEQVRLNLAKFMNTVSASMNLRVALLTSNDPNRNGMTLAPKSAADRQLNTWTFSYHPLAFAALTLCGNRILDDSSSACRNIAMRLADDDDYRTDSAPLISWTKVFGAYGSSQFRDPLADFYRSTSKKVFVFVTDDDANVRSLFGNIIDGASASEFTGIFASKFPNERPKVFGFLGLGGGQSPCQARTASTYLSLVNQTGGASFNVCEADWTSHFSQLTDRIVQIGKSSFDLSREALSVSKVVLDGNVLSATNSPPDYVVVGSTITLDRSKLISGTNQTVSITYTAIIN